MTFKEDFKPSRVYNKLVIDAINKDIANDRSIIIIPNTFDIDIKNNNKKYLCGTGRMECFDVIVRLMKIIRMIMNEMVMRVIKMVVKIMMIKVIGIVIVIIKFINVIVGLVSITPGHVKLD